MSSDTEYYELRIELDPDPENPRGGWDHMGTMYCHHGRYVLGDKHKLTVEEVLALVAKVRKEGGVVFPLYMYDHSGLTVSTKPFDCPWDSGQIGFIVADRKAILEHFDIKRMTKKHREAAEKVLLGEVEEYDTYLRGEVYGYAIANKETGEVVDSCWGFYGEDYCREQGEFAKNYWEAREKAAIQAVTTDFAL